jgi:Protein kinase domain
MHRDLKPANILVVEVDGKPVPRIIDFGLAKVATPQGGGEILFTQVGAWVGTPGYMSPEQADPQHRGCGYPHRRVFARRGALRPAHRVLAFRNEGLAKAKKEWDCLPSMHPSQAH